MIKQKERKEKRGKARKNGWDGELVYVFLNAPVKCRFDRKSFSDEQAERALAEAESLSRKIWIDKTYVDFAGTKFEKTFLSEEGWNALRNLIKDTDYGNTADSAQRLALENCFRGMAVEYVRQAMQELGWDVDAMEIYAEDDDFDVEYYPDVAEEWRRYPGKWQTW